MREQMQARGTERKKGDIEKNMYVKSLLKKKNNRTYREGPESKKDIGSGLRGPGVKDKYAQIREKKGGIGCYIQQIISINRTSGENLKS